MARTKTLTAALLCVAAAAWGLHATAQDAPAPTPNQTAASAQPTSSPEPQPTEAAPQGDAPIAQPSAATASDPQETPAAPVAAEQADNGVPAAAAPGADNASPAQPVQQAAAGNGTSALPRAAMTAASPSAGRAEVEIESVRPSASTPSDEAEMRIRGIRTNEYFYQSYGRPDLCRALVTGKFEPVGNPEVVDVNSAKLVGIMWGASDRFALLEDGYGNGFILHAGDRVRNGRIEAINETSVVASITLYGITSRVILRLEPQREGKKR